MIKLGQIVQLRSGRKGPHRYGISEPVLNYMYSDSVVSSLQPTEPFHMARLLSAPFFLDLMVSLSSFHCRIPCITAINMNL